MLLTPYQFHIPSLKLAYCQLFYLFKKRTGR
jgi:hypothetical protein